MNYTFEELPIAVNKLHQRLDSIEKLLLNSRQEKTLTSDELLTVQQASELVNLAVPTLYSKVSLKEIPYCKKGKRLYFSRSELIEWITEGKEPTKAETILAVQGRMTRPHQKRR